MTKTTPDLAPAPSAGPEDHGARRRQAGIAAAVAAVLVLVIAGTAIWSSRGGEDTTTTSATPSTTTSANADPTTTADRTTTEAPTTTAVQPSAVEPLEPFLAAAATLDAQLQEAATAINGGGPPWTGVTQQMADAVQAADIGPVATAVPAGLPHDLLQKVVLVYSDLSSRRRAMESFSSAPDFPYRPIDPLAELANGHAAAVRFDDDLAALRTLAESTPPVTIAAHDSQEAAEALLYLRYVDLANGGCDSRGGAVVTDLPDLDWIHSEVPDATPEGKSEFDGHIGGIQFTADLDTNGSWRIVIQAC
jgi:hypothetical protein